MISSADTASINLTGNETAQRIIGNNRANVIIGGEATTSSTPDVERRAEFCDPFDAGLSALFDCSHGRTSLTVKK